MNRIVFVSFLFILVKIISPVGVHAQTIQKSAQDTTRPIVIKKGEPQQIPLKRIDKPAAGQQPKLKPGEIELKSKPKPQSEMNQTIIRPIDNPETKRLMQKALDVANSGDVQGSIIYFDSILMKDKKHAAAYFYRAKARHDTGKGLEALPDVDSAIKYKPDMASAFFLKGEINLENGHPDLAIESFTKAVELKPGYVDALNLRGVAKTRYGRHSDAITDYQSALKSKPNNPVILFNLGTSQAALHQYDSAVISFTGAIQRDSLNQSAFTNRGNCFVMMQKYSEAVQDYTRVINLAPDNADAFYNRGAAYHYIGDTEHSCADFKQSATLGSRKAQDAVLKYCSQ